MQLRDSWTILKETATDWNEDEAPRLAASLAYYTIMSLAPLVVIAMSVIGLIFDEDAARGHIASQLVGIVGEQAAKAIQGIVQNARTPSAGIVSSTIGIGVLLAGASGVFGELQSSLNTIWDVAPKPGRGIWGLVKARFLSFTMVLGVAFMLLVSLLLSAALAATGYFLESVLPGGEATWQIVTSVISLGMVTLLFALIFKVIPDVRIEWRDVWVGAIGTALLFTMGKLLLGLYLGKSTVSSSYGAAGSLVVLVLWVNYSAQILFFGAEFTQVHARHRGRELRPTKDAVPLERQEPRADAVPPASTARG
jgi:membrane protein